MNRLERRAFLTGAVIMATQVAEYFQGEEYAQTPEAWSDRFDGAYKTLTFFESEPENLQAMLENAEAVIEENETEL